MISIDFIRILKVIWRADPKVWKADLMTLSGVCFCFGLIWTLLAGVAGIIEVLKLSY